MVDSLIIDKAGDEDASAIRALVVAAGLNGESIFDGDNHILVARGSDNSLVGVAGIAWHHPDALLRSVAVAETGRGRGVGAKLVAAALDTMRRHSVRCAYLLTNDADAYFARFGFCRVDREQVSGPVTSNPQFVTECPVTAITMELVLDSR